MNRNASHEGPARAWALGLAATIATGFALSGCSATSGEAVRPPGGGAPPTVPVVSAQAIEKSMPVDVRGIGSVEASSVVAVRAQLTGELTSVTFKEGDEVSAGQVLFTLDRRPLEAALKQAEANLQRDLAQAANATAQAKRYDDLATRGIATRDQLGTSVANAEAMDATVGADRAAVENAKIQLEYATISAPIGGRTGQLMVHPGNLVRANDTTPLVIINRVAPVNVSFAVPEAQLPELRRSLARGAVKVMVQPPGDAPAEGRITFVDSGVDPTTGTIKVKGSFPNTDHRLWPGAFVNVVLTLSTDQNAVVVPTAAIQTGQQGDYVFAIKADQTVELRPVKVSRATADETIVTSGVKPGDILVRDGQLRLVNGSRISIKQDAQKPAP
jgi:multidrug efflux system membrane fusion protein